jgi:hypothetical protein
MPHDTDNMKVYPLKDLAALKAYAKHHHDHEIEFLEIRKRAEAEIMEAHDKHRSAMRVLWEEMCEQVGLDPNKTWDSEDWTAEVHYADAGFGAIVYHPDPLTQAIAETATPSGPKGTMH